ncbi:uncharacterized protein BCR38DRAFT_407166 [Pseudomassariella vexata]|uniref:AA1-like domain-containing protein n=1 Tax=Pseudomassariella vexata TaxID=1141098 RepID=A0A1Y2E6M2_9PEZI|nr:uncharacterized protein BCR38DRAFT_407166 [Pseudomassariella vexata]ORY67159.1 hypothetical protein BCR38DRAFT_407166 [Pseudomassariella vexata]
MLLTTLLITSGLAVAALVSQASEPQEFHIPLINVIHPSGRPGQSTYCTVRINATDASTNTSAQCNAKFGPCVGSSSTDDPEPEIPYPNATHPEPCDDPSFRFYFPTYQSIGNFSVHITHAYEDASGEEATHEGETETVTRDNYPDGYLYVCGGSGVCSATFYNDDNPIVLPFLDH